MDFLIFTPFIFVIVAMVFIRKTAKKKTALGRYFRWWWNTSFKIAAHMPLTGWMANFIIAETEEELRLKDEYVSIGASADKFASDRLERKARQERKTEQIRQELLARGAQNFDIDSDCNSATYFDEKGRKVEVKITWDSEN